MFGEGGEFGEAFGSGFELFVFPDEKFARALLYADCDVFAQHKAGRGEHLEAGGSEGSEQDDAVALADADVRGVFREGDDFEARGVEGLED